MALFFNAGASDGSADCGRASFARRHCYRDLDRKKVGGMVGRRVYLSNGCVASRRTGRVSMVFALAAGIRPVDRDAADHYLDSEYYPHLLCVAPAHSRMAVGATWLDCAGGVRIGGTNCCNHRVAAGHTIGHTPVLSGRSRVKPTASVEICIQER